MSRPTSPFPLWLRVGLSLFVAVLIPVYWRHHGPANFLWFSDIALLAAVVVLWLGSRTLASMMAVGVLLPELAWNFGFFLQLFTGAEFIGLASYMFDAGEPLYLRGLSLFHILLPPLLLWMVHRLGYDRRALVFQSLLAWLVLPLSYFFSTPEQNINWVHGFGDPSAVLLPGFYHVIVLMLMFPLVVFLPTHWFLARWRGDTGPGA